MRGWAGKISPLALSLGLVHVVSPDVDTVTSDQDGVGIRILLHGLLEILGQVLLMRGILNDGDPQRVVIAQVPLLGHAPPEALDLLNVVDLKHLVLARPLSLEEQRHEDCPLGVRVDAAAGVAAGKGREEERRALGGLVAGRGAEICALLVVLLGAVEGEDVDVGVLHEFLLDARGGDVDAVTVSMCKYIAMLPLDCSKFSSCSGLYDSFLISLESFTKNNHKNSTPITQWQEIGVSCSKKQMKQVV